MNEENIFEIISFYEFIELSELDSIRAKLREAMIEFSVFGTIIIAEEGYNASLSAQPATIKPFISRIEKILGTTIKHKSSYHSESPFRKHEIKIKPEIVTLRQSVDISKGIGTHVKPKDWNAVISDPETVVLDARNFYEVMNGTFQNAVDPKTEKFSELPEFVKENLDPEKNPKIAMFCTGGIRCEKFAPYMKQLGFKEIFQLEGGILKYLEEVPEKEQLWEGECFVFDERKTLDKELKKGSGKDQSLRYNNKKKRTEEQHS
jgi:UPF0176 protein